MKINLVRPVFLLNNVRTLIFMVVRYGYIFLYVINSIQPKFTFTPCFLISPFYYYIILENRIFFEKKLLKKIRK